MNSTIFALDLAKHVIQAHWVEAETGEICRQTLKRGKVLEFFVNRSRAVIAMEACGSAHHWARKLMTLGHEVRLIAPQFVRPFVKTNKTDAADAQAIWETAQRPGMKFVPVKSVGQQSVLALHRIRSLLVKMRTMQVNELRGLLYEFGADIPQGRVKGMNCMPKELERLEDILPAMVIETMREQIKRIEALDKDIADTEKKLAAWKKDDQSATKLADIPGVGLLTATAAVATVGDAKAFSSGREFAAFMGLVPRQSGTGGRVKLLGISKRGDVYLRTLLIHGARAVIRCQKEREPWLEKLLARRPVNVAVVALANKMARTIWALLPITVRMNSDLTLVDSL